MMDGKRRPRRGTIRREGIPPPTRYGWGALLDLREEEALVVLWLCRKIERREPLIQSALSRECHVRKSTAAVILAGYWVPWASKVTGTAANLPESKASKELEQVGEKLRELLGTAQNEY